MEKEIKKLKKNMKFIETRDSFFKSRIYLGQGQGQGGGI